MRGFDVREALYVGLEIHDPLMKGSGPWVVLIRPLGEMYKRTVWGIMHFCPKIKVQQIYF